MMKTLKEKAAHLLAHIDMLVTDEEPAKTFHESIVELLREITNALEPEPVAYQVRNGWVDVVIYQRQIDADNCAKDQQKRHDLSGSLAHFCVVPLYTAPPAPEPAPEPVGEVVDFNGWRIVRWKVKESSFPLGTKFYAAPPAPSVPDGWKNAAEWLRNNYQDYPNISSLCEAMVAQSANNGSN